MRRLLFKGFCLVLFVSAIGVVVSIPMSAEEVIDPPRPRPSMASFEVPLFVDEGGAVTIDPAPGNFTLTFSDDGTGNVMFFGDSDTEGTFRCAVYHGQDGCPDDFHSLIAQRKAKELWEKDREDPVEVDDSVKMASGEGTTWGYFAPMFGAVEPKPVKFTNPARVDQQMNHNAKVCIAILEAIMTQDQVYAFEAALAPSPTEALGQLREVRKALGRSGLTAGHKVVMELDTAILAAENDAALEAVE